MVDTATASVTNGTQQFIADVTNEAQHAAAQAALALNSTGIPLELLPGASQAVKADSSAGAAGQKASAVQKANPDASAALAALPVGAAAASGLPLTGAAAGLPLAAAAAGAALLPALLSIPVVVPPGRRLLQPVGFPFCFVQYHFQHDGHV